MKKVIFLTILFFLTGFGFYLSYSDNFEVKNNLQIVTPSANNNRFNSIATDNTSTKSKEVNKILDLIDSAKVSEEKETINLLNQDIYNKAKALSQRSQLADLKCVELSENDKEIRIWNIDTLYSSITKGYVFSFNNGQWEGMFIIDVDKEHNFKKRYFEDPMSGWKDWNIFIENEITPGKVENSNSQTSGNDVMVVVIEVKFGQKYAKNIFYDGSSNESLIDKIFKKIKVEFYNDKIKWSEF